MSRRLALAALLVVGACLYTAASSAQAAPATGHPVVTIAR